MKQQFRRIRARTVSGVVAALFAAQAWAIDPFTVRDIRIEGLQRVEPGTVFASLPVRVGDQYTDEKGSTAIRSLFGLGLFKDVRLEVNDGVLVVIVEERPTVADVDFVGIKEFDKDVLRKALRDIGLTEGRPYDQALADRAEQELRRQYISRSLYGAEVVTTITPAERNRVNLTFTVTEGDLARIKDIRIVGNKAFSEGTLRDLFDLDTGGWLSWYTKSDRYSRPKLNADLEALRSYYLSRGYLEFRIDSTQVAISPNKQDISITINVTEGDRFVVSGVKLEGNYLGKDEEFKTLVRIRPGEAYNANEVAETTKAFTDYFAGFGYAFANVEARPEIDRSTGRVNLLLVADPSRRAYVRRVNIAGNNRTRDEVIRREFRQFESSWYDGDKIKLSRDRVDRLGFFRSLNIETVDVPGAPEQVDLNVTVEEKPTGSLSLSAGFSSAEKVTLGFGIKQENAFGTGQYLGIDVNTSKYNRVIALNNTNPYFTQDGVSRTVDLYHRNAKPYETQGGNYSLATTGLGMRFGIPFSEFDTVFFGANAERLEIDPGTNIPAAYLFYAAKIGGFTSNSLPFTVGWARDSRDSALAPTNGRLQRLNGELGLIGDNRYVRANYQYQQYIPLSKQYTIAFNGELGYGKGLSGRPFPVFKNFYSGGLGSVRGFEQSTLGPRDITGSVIGGTRKITLSSELYVPFPGAGNDRTLRLFGFTDIGNVYGEFDPVELKELRASVGAGISWISPIGPLRFAIAQPVRKFAGDRIQKLQFQIGTSF
ncbi:MULTISPECIES: outer membrane protein assembly factor BamA [Ramlibacter]|uniref:Outer membrane protein assembly factor BamA n=1 Tax=Ramlibacter pinisoli TaxID=2682844 RepID=A0A6N8IZ29_9BURK|nr:MULTISPECIES: outer membrane protein assembly factor BamA [Ramlibacter]MBA2961309.1 outer membrane protein assembly factor BamA [Ramlibacter sp. CGMCC 1.13660]MVQ31253.1 outer membrane protein assembly factor BamA [Ramlibacter pinisoli]